MDEKFKAHFLTGVTRARNNHMHPIQNGFTKLGPVQAADAALFSRLSQLEQNIAAERTLQGNINQLIFTLLWVFKVAQDHFTSRRAHPWTVRIHHDFTVTDGIQPRPILGFVGGVDNYEVLVRVAAVNQQVINHVGMWIHEMGIKRVTYLKG